MGGVSCVRGLRFPVASVVAMLAEDLVVGVGSVSSRPEGLSRRCGGPEGTGGCLLI